MQVLPGDPAASLLGPDASAQDVKAVRHELHLDQPLPVRYVDWLGNVLHGDFGYSLLRRRPISELLQQAWMNTAILAGVSALFGLVTGALCGIVAAIYRGKWVDKVLSAVTLVGLSVPSFWLAIILLIVFSSWLKVLPTTGTGLGQGPFQLFRHLAMPVLAGGLVTQGITARVTRAAMVEAYEADFVATLRAKGLKSRQILWHVWKNALNPILTTSGLQIGYLLGGQVLIETIFAWPGMGRLVYTAISGRDLAVVQGAMLVIACGFVIINLVVDVVQTIVNPSLRQVTV
jgi:peptide/nickel transport system permease protein